MANVPITVAHGDGIGPEIMAATLHIIQAAGARIDIETIEIGEKVYLSGNAAGIAPEAYESLRRTKVFLKAPITTPQGGGYKSLNVTVRKTFGQFANIRPCVAYHPFVDTKHSGVCVLFVFADDDDIHAGMFGVNEWMIRHARADVGELPERFAHRHVQRFITATLWRSDRRFQKYFCAAQ